MRRAALALLLSACSAPPPPGSVGTEAPAYAAETIDGDTLSLNSLRGQVVLLNVWATWCVPCRKEMPELQALAQQHGSAGLRVVGVSVDESGSDEVIRQFTKDLGITYTVLRDPGERINDLFYVIGVPASFLIDRTGRIAWRFQGPFSRNDSTLQAALQAAL